MSLRLSLVLASVASLAVGAAGCGADLCKGVTGTCIPIASGTSESTIGTKLATAAPGSTVVFDTGTFKFANTLSCTSSTTQLTIRGAGVDKTILDWKGQAAGAQGVFCNADGFTIQDLTIRDTGGDGIKVESADQVTFRNVKVTWTDPDSTTHGAYGLYPVQSKHVLISNCTVVGAADAGIYVGQSDQILVTKSMAMDNVAGIEIENSTNAEVVDNEAHGNTAGILVFALPELMKKKSQYVRVANNHAHDNNGANFAKVGSIVQKVPAGVGMMVMAADTVEVTGNMIENNNTVGLGVVSYYIAQVSTTDTMYYYYPTNVWEHDNTWTGNGSAPDPTNLIGAGLAATFSGKAVPDILWDGIPDAALAQSKPSNPQSICLSGGGTPGWANLNLGVSQNVPFQYVSDPAPYSCTGTAVASVTLPQGNQ